MNLLLRLRHLLNRRAQVLTPAPEAYNRLAAEYDSAAENMMIALDEKLFAQMLAPVALSGRNVLDFGCGTGRYWPRLLAQSPASLVGYDASEEMLRLLKKKLPQADVHLSDGTGLFPTPPASIDVLISTLTIHYLENPGRHFLEWNRVLRPGGTVLITGYHPDALKDSAAIRFPHASGTIAVRHNGCSLEQILELARQAGWECRDCVELPVDESVKHFYDLKGALSAYDHAKGKPIIYGLRFRKQGVVADP